MAGPLSLSSRVEVFPCPNCHETINTSVKECPFCLTPIDHGAADASAAATSRISQACSDASYLASCGSNFRKLAQCDRGAEESGHPLADRGTV
jgi:hypothetical protein